MKKIFKFFTFFMAGVMGYFSPITINHGDTGCCAECVMKREEEVEIVYQEEDDISSDD